MALQEVTNAADKIEIVGAYKTVQVRSATWVERDGQMIGSPEYHRHVIQVGEDYSNEAPEVQAICAALHTQEVKDAYAAKKAEEKI